MDKTILVFSKTRTFSLARFGEDTVRDTVKKTTFYVGDDFNV